MGGILWKNRVAIRRQPPIIPCRDIVRRRQRPDPTPLLPRRGRPLDGTKTNGTVGTIHTSLRTVSSSTESQQYPETSTPIMTDHPPQQGYPSAPQSPQPSAYPTPPLVRPSSGAASWYAGLLIFCFLPFISSVVASIAMICVGLMYRRQNLEPTRTVGARAASWGLTYLLATLLFLGLHFYLLFALDGTEAADAFFPIGIPITIWLLISVLHFFLSIVGGVKAGRGRAMGFYGIPFFR